ncbi:tRNA-dihydrouridine synthase [Candidatus Parcubacteria bacterium]|nr:tRNA-dihydrouridine synthase [Candidatus Parcubacteria bacterium]
MTYFQWRTLNTFRKLLGLPPRLNFGFWQKLKTRIENGGEKMVVLAPMADVTDEAFREIIRKYSRAGELGGGPDVFWTEFVSSDGLCSVGREVLLRDLEYGEGERPIVAQLFSSNPKNMEKTARMCKELGFDGIDINMGCPDRSIIKQVAGSAMITQPKLARQIIRAAQKGAWPLPVSVKTRIGYNKVEIDNWVPNLLSCDIPVLTMHLRTRKELSKVPAHWEMANLIREEIRNKKLETMYIANGDIQTLKDAKDKNSNYDIDGVMVGRGIFGNPWFFDSNRDPESISIKEKLEVMLEHTKLFLERLGDIKNFAIMKKHYKAYVNGFDGAKDLRVKLMESHSYDEIERHVRVFLGN